MLYRFYDKGGVLLYVGITSVGPSRWSEHRRNRPWWHESKSATIEHFATREEAEAAERHAIRTEMPLYNKVHSTGRPAEQIIEADDVHHFEHWRDMAGNGDRAVKLWLSPEIYLEPCVDELYNNGGADQFWYWVGEVQDRYPVEYEADAIPIYWSVLPVHEVAPFQTLEWTTDDFLSFFTWPVDSYGRSIDWFSLEVRHDRFPDFVEYLGWKPSPLQRTCPLRSIVESKSGHWGGRRAHNLEPWRRLKEGAA